MDALKKPKTDKEIAEWVCAEYDRMSTSRYNFESQWREVGERTDPSGKQQFGAGEFQTPGEKKTSKILDSTAVIAVNRFASILDSLLTPRNQTWHRLAVNNEELAKDRDVALWFENTNKKLFNFRYDPTANFASQNQKDYKSLGRYGNSGLFIDDQVGRYGLRYKSVHLSGLYFDENHQGTVDRVIRAFMMDARQAKQKWGDNLPKEIKDCTDMNRQFKFLHKVCPRTDDYDDSRLDAKGKKYASYYVSVDGKHFIEEGGYNTFPYSVCRYEQSDDEVYGRGPLMEVLPSIKTLNEQKRILLKQGHKALDPTLIVHDDGILNGFNHRPGALNFGGVTADGRPLVHALPVGNIAVGKELMDDERAVINDACLVSLFQILIESPTKTATEVVELAKEKGILLAPTMGRLQSERLGSTIDRELDALSSQGALDPMPDALIEARGEYQIYYDSPLTRAARAEEASGLMRALEMALSVVNVTQDPSVLDHFNFDVAVPEVMSQQGVPEKFKRSLKEVEMLRQGRAQQAQVAQMVEAGPSIAAVTKAAASMKGAG